MRTALGLEPWDESRMRADLLVVARELPRERLDTVADLPAVPGCYIMFFATPRLAPSLSSLVSHGCLAGYVGVAARSVRERISRHRLHIAKSRDLEERDVWLAVLPCSSTASAYFAEAALIEALQPPLQGTGWGSKATGKNRRERNHADALFPGRRDAADPSPAAVAAARLRILDHLLKLDPDVPRWTALL